MNLKDKLIGAGAVLLAFAGLGSAVAAASTPSTKPPAVHSRSTTAAEPTTATDQDQLQQGDQTTPDVAGARDTTEASDKAEGPESANEKAEAPESANETESATDADGPGGHADPPGQVDNQQEGNH